MRSAGHLPHASTRFACSLCTSVSFSVDASGDDGKEQIKRRVRNTPQLRIS
ncbi:hypothetical protein [Dermatophilus congolensis]|uniref:hypothetical protein n=1 Tax=Dermatophilus congolensis TaxID=1863 RepID=UPI0015EFE1A6|nr:hypothetical protein [Dermatophilus congolensis]